MGASWTSFEERVRLLAENIWSRPCEPKRIGGVNLDGVIHIAQDVANFIEITEERELGKVREDVVKLETARLAAFHEGIVARCFCVINGSVTPAMKDAGGNRIRVMSIEDFSKLFFDFASYSASRMSAAFGSSINPLTGAIDETDYVPVRYLQDGKKDDLSAGDVARMLQRGQNIIMLGEYGTGKSRCIREVFRHLKDQADAEYCYPMAIDLRKSWGLQRAEELIRRHLSDLGHESLGDQGIRAFKKGALALLLDGFDEIGSQAWSSDAGKLRLIRSRSLDGVKELVAGSAGGVLISGREHYFSSSDEMFSALGMSASTTSVLRCKNEFSETELLEYFKQRDIDVEVPDWLPRRPLICQTIGDLAAEQFDEMFGDEGGGEIAFWDHFIRVLCERDAKIHVSFDADTIYSLFLHLARATRSKPANVGPLSLIELQASFEAATGAAPVEEASVMLQRLPSLARISPESNDRQFVDVYILDGLRAKDVAKSCQSPEIAFPQIAGAKWNNALDDLGQRVLANDTAVGDKAKLEFAKKAQLAGNQVLVSDLVAALLRESSDKFNFDGFAVNQGEFLYFTLSERVVENLTVANSYLGELALPPKSASGVQIHDCITPKVSGISSPAALPPWITKLDAEVFDSVASVSRIRRIGLDAAHVILITIIRKTFFQKGTGRKEEALLRGLGSLAPRSIADKILNLMESEGLLSKFRGKEGTVYVPERAHAQRMQKILEELKASDDVLWQKVGEF